jgi:inhibitor of cysteine peptidase
MTVAARFGLVPPDLGNTRAMRVRLLLVSLLLVGALVAGCGGDSDSSGQLDLTAADNGGDLSATTGEQVVLTLESNRSTGYSWSLVTEPDPNVLAFVSSNYIQPSDADRVGAAGTEVWTWNAVGEGSATLHLQYVRPSDPTDVGEEFEAMVEVE